MWKHFPLYKAIIGQQTNKQTKQIEIEMKRNETFINNKYLQATDVLMKSNSLHIQLTMKMKN